MEELRTNDYLKGIVHNLPESPGIYQYLNAEGTIIYVGKAKNLKRRVSSYFNSCLLYTSELGKSRGDNQGILPQRMESCQRKQLLIFKKKSKDTWF